MGIWVERPDKPLKNNGALEEDKIAAIGVRLRKWITLHGLSINLDPDLSHFQGIVPCGIKNMGLQALLIWVCQFQCMIWTTRSKNLFQGILENLN